MNLPNFLTLLRFLMAGVVFYWIAVGSSFWLDVALLLFIVACFTDFFDGYYARKLGKETAFGRIADPFADKFMVTGCLLFLLERMQASGVEVAINALAVFIILAREFLISSIRAYAESQGIVFPSIMLGKVKAVWQYFAIGIMILYLSHGQDFLVDFFPGIVLFAIWSTVLLTLLSALPYLQRARKELSQTSD
jgi:CDP-diacylglycerol--glycerol-3-phosphate 3-phosphatidyltransferase